MTLNRSYLLTLTCFGRVFFFTVSTSFRRIKSYSFVQVLTLKTDPAFFLLGQVNSVPFVFFKFLCVFSAPGGFNYTTAKQEMREA